MKYQVVESYTDASGHYETWRGPKHNTKEEAQKEVSYHMKTCPREEFMATSWDIVEVEE
jgi:hypothetical protein